MLPPDLPFHKLPGNANERSPYHCLYLDTEAVIAADGRDEVHTPRCWWGKHERRHTGKGWPEGAGDSWGPDVAGMTDYLESIVTTKHPLWVFTHNLSYDLGLTKLPLVLMDRGWKLGKHNLASDAPWCNLQLGKRSVWVVDSYSWLRKPLAEVGDRLGIPKRALPDQDDSEEAWYGRCRQDVEIMAAVMGQLMDWWDAERLGHWSYTGPGCGWNAMRHMCTRSDTDAYRAGRQRLTDGTLDLQAGKVTICTDPVVRAFERRALYQGMREVSYVGQLPPGAWANFDLKSAHLSIAAGKLLPCRLSDWGDSLPVDSPKIGGRFHGVIAECRVRCQEPMYPLRVGDHVLHPVGEFWTVLCDPEIADARERGALLEVGRWQGYALNHYMQPWAKWCGELIDQAPDDLPPAAWLAAKGWSRTVIGKWGARTSRWEPIGETDDWGWSYAPANPVAAQPVPALVQLGHTLYDVVRDQEGDNAFPAILAWVQSWVRVQLRQLIAEVGTTHVVQCNTDGLVLDAQSAGMAMGGWDETGNPCPATWDSVIASAAAVGDALGGVTVRCKGLYRAGAILSPQHLVLDGVRVLSGIPGKVERIDGWRYSFLTWPKLAGQLRSGYAEGYRRRWVERDLSRVPVSRWVCTDGCALPVWVTVGAGRSVRVLPAAGTTCEHGVGPRPVQASWLLRLSGETAPAG